MTDAAGTPLVLALDDPAAELALVGGKAASLARLARAGLPVPDGFYVTTSAYRRFVADNGLQDRILEAVAGVSSEDLPALNRASALIGALFAGAAIPGDVADAVRDGYAKLGGADTPVAVRSSATAEDLPEMSFAGQQDTYLNVRGEALVLEAVRRCWASLWTARAIGYRASHGIAPDDVSLAAVVQTLVPAQAAGIMFTANPVTGSRDQVMISAAWGLGEAVVGGLVTPDTVVVDKESRRVVETVVADKETMTVRTAEGTREEPVPANLRTAPVLADEQAIALADFGLTIERLYGMPMDVEWAIDEAGIAILQARPITALPEAGPKPVQPADWVLPRANGRYMRSSVLELLPDPLSPLFATLGLPAWSRATMALGDVIGVQMKGLFTEGVYTTVNGYGYYDLTMTAKDTAVMTIWMFPFLAKAPKLLRSSVPRWQQERESYAALTDRWARRELTSASAADLLQGVRDITDEAASYYLSIQSGVLPSAYMSETWFTWIYEHLIKRKDDPPALTFMLGFDSQPIRAEKSLYDLGMWVREHDDVASALRTMPAECFTKAYREYVEGTANTEGEGGEFWHRLDEHLKAYGHVIYDLDFAKPVLADDPAPVLETLRFFMTGDAPDPYARQLAAQTAREEATEGILGRLHGMRRHWFRDSLATAQKFAPMREDGLADAGLGWSALRRTLHEIGSRLVAQSALDDADDTYWLTVDELQLVVADLDAGRAPTDERATVAERRLTWRSERAVTPPLALPLKGGTKFLGIDLSSVMPGRTSQAEGSVLEGVPGSPGRITGPVRVIHGPDEFEQMRPGDILVARITTPAWTPLFALAAGIVTDIGGPLSHGSIVAREYHIPAVLGTGSATERLAGARRVTVDGDAGTVTIED